MTNREWVSDGRNKIHFVMNPPLAKTWDFGIWKERKGDILKFAKLRIDVNEENFSETYLKKGR